MRPEATAERPALAAPASSAPEDHRPYGYGHFDYDVMPSIGTAMSYQGQVEPFFSTPRIRPHGAVVGIAPDADGYAMESCFGVRRLEGRGRGHRLSQVFDGPTSMRLHGESDERRCAVSAQQHCAASEPGFEPSAVPSGLSATVTPVRRPGLPTHTCICRGAFACCAFLFPRFIIGFSFGYTTSKQTLAPVVWILRDLDLCVFPAGYRQEPEARNEQHVQRAIAEAMSLHNDGLHPGRYVTEYSGASTRRRPQ
jgi:hypothetical protein